MNFYFDKTGIEYYKNNSQKIRVMSEHWVENNIFCPCCGNSHIIKLENNKPAADFQCDNCKEVYELKSKKGKMGKKISDGAYLTMIERIKSIDNPNLFLLNYSSDCNMFHIVDPLYLPIKDLVETINSVGINMLPVSDTLMNDIINGMLTNDDRKQAVSGIIQDLNKERRLIYTSLVKPSFAFTVNYLKSCRFSLEKN